jgi:HEAT repeat protein
LFILDGVLRWLCHRKTPSKPSFIIAKMEFNGMEELLRLMAELTSGDDERAEAAIPGLAAHGEAAVETLRPLLNSPDADLRWWAVRALAEIPAPGVPGLLLKALGADELAVRQCAALGLRRQPLERAVPALVEALSNPDYLLSNLAGDALIAIGSPAVPALIEVMQSGVQAARLVAACPGDDRRPPRHPGPLRV